MVKVSDINYVAYLKVFENINFDTFEKISIDSRREQTQFVYNDLMRDDYFKYISNYSKNDISVFMNVIRELKTMVHIKGN